LGKIQRKKKNGRKRRGERREREGKRRERGEEL
jgi:hypothetical protein